MYQLGDYNDYLTVSNKVCISSYVSSCFNPDFDYTFSWNYDVLVSRSDGYILFNNIINSMSRSHSEYIKGAIEQYMYPDAASRGGMCNIEREIKSYMRRKLWP